MILLKNFQESPFFEVLGIADFRKIWYSQILSQVTINFINFVLVLRVFEATGSTVAVSFVWIFYAIPAILLGPFSGTIVDLTDKRRILILTTILEAVIVLFYLFVKTKIWPLYSIIFLYSLVNQLYIPAEGSTLTGVVPKKLFASANTLFLFTMYASFLLGYGIAGSAIRLVGRNTPFLIGAFFLALASLCVYFLPRGLTNGKGRVKRIEDFWGKVVEGYEFIRKNMVVLYPLILLVMANIMVSVFAVMAPLFATEILQVDLLDISHLVVVPLGLGTILGAAGAVMVLKKIRKKRVITFGLMLIFGVLVFDSLILPRLFLWRVPVSMLATFFLGLGLAALFIPAQTSIQEKTPEEFRGRVFGVLGFLFTLAAVLPVLLAAAIADTIGVAWVIFLLALLIGAAAVYSQREPYLKLNNGNRH